MPADPPALETLERALDPDEAMETFMTETGAVVEAVDEEEAEVGAVNVKTAVGGGRVVSRTLAPHAGALSQRQRHRPSCLLTLDP